MRRSRYSSFSESLGASLAPLLAPLHDPRNAPQERGAPRAGGEGVSAAVQTLRVELEEALVEASERRPHVLVSGPPKSGKSTLMVALARSYVTKVSGLPSLPSPVRVVHAPSWSLTVVRNDGTSDTFKDPTGARVEVQRAHRIWIDALRHAQERGVEFDAHEFAPRAAQRVELRTPAAALKESRVALVEIPCCGGQGALDRERMLEAFADEAASSVLVLRTEDLARPLELAALEPQIAPGRSAFLVLNLDPGRGDLGPAGERLVSLDREDPVALIETFQSLGASRPWLDAFDNGRLRVHLLPLLEIAAARLQGAEDTGGRPRSVWASAGRRAERSDALGEDALASLEDELDASLHEGERWCSHVRETLRGVESVLDELQRALEDSSGDDGAPAGPRSSRSDPRVALRQARESVQKIRGQHLKVDS